MNNYKNENKYTLSNIIEHINIHSSQRDKQVKVRKSVDLAIKELEENILNVKVTLVEKVIKYITLGTVSYENKYKELIFSYKDKIKKLKANSIDADINAINGEILRLKEKFEKNLSFFRNLLLKFQTNLLSLSDNRYINNYKKEELKEELKELIFNREEFCLHETIKDDIRELLKFKENPKAWIEKKNTFFVQNEKVKEKTFFDTIESNPLTDKQQDAVLINENNNLILAGAGSGKTSVIVAKVVYLIKEEVLHPNEILILAFNKNAQVELTERFEAKNIKVQIRTFHSFGLSIIAESLSQKLNLCPTAESQNNMTKFIQETIRTLMSSMSGFLESFLIFMSYFRIPYKSEYEFSSLGEYYEYQKNYDMKTLKHKVQEKGKEQGKTFVTLKEETVKSHQELVIANFLTLNGIDYLYEEPYEYKTYTVDKGQYKPDFYLPQYGVYIEHFGIDRDNKTAPYIDNKAYLDGIEWKLALHEEKYTPLIQTFSYEFSENILLKSLKNKLLRHNVVFRELEFAEISELLKESIENNEFTKLFTTFLNHYKSNMYSMEELKDKAKDTERTNLFLELFEYIFNEYKKYQERNHCVDFDDMIVQALTSVRNDEYSHTFKHIFIDEFQDISTTRAKLIKSLLHINDTSITAVGDDWQSINRFAGSNIKIIQDFEKVFGISRTVALDYTFRFDNIVSDIASTFIQKNPYQIKKEIRTIKNQNLNRFSLLLYWTTGNSEEDLKKILNFIEKKEKTSKKTVMVLARYNFIFNDLKTLRNKYVNLDIIFSTIHGSKGNEADYVIILNVDNGKYGFPSKIVDDPILDIVIPKGDDYEDSEERRLFYVALTRTKGAIFLLSDMYNKSPFIKELIEEKKDEIYFINDPKIKLSTCPACKTGLLKKRDKSKDKSKHLYGCSHFPRCKYIENIQYCENCSSEVLKDVDNKVAKCVNDTCGFESLLCFKCHGYMIEKKGQYGKYLGCSNFPKCKHTKNVELK